MGLIKVISLIGLGFYVSIRRKHNAIDTYLFPAAYVSFVILLFSMV